MGKGCIPSCRSARLPLPVGGMPPAVAPAGPGRRLSSTTMPNSHGHGPFLRVLMCPGCFCELILLGAEQSRGLIDSNASRQIKPDSERPRLLRTSPASCPTSLNLGPAPARLRLTGCTCIAPAPAPVTHGRFSASTLTCRPAPGPSTSLAG